MTPAVWVLGVLSSMLVAAIHAKAPAWVVAAVLILVGIVIIAFLIVYCHKAYADPSFIRSEKYALAKQYLEATKWGDSDKGEVRALDAVLEPKQAVLGSGVPVREDRADRAEGHPTAEPGPPQES